MDEKLVEQISTSSGIPQMLVSRSAQARAEASGVSTDDVLNSWTGGEAIQASPSITTEPETEVVIIEEQSPSFSEEIIEEVEPEITAPSIQTEVLIKEDLPLSLIHI